MTAPTPKPEEPQPPVNTAAHRWRLSRPAAMAISATLAFAIFSIALTSVLPSPHTRSDYLIVGTLSTLAALITLFAGLVLGRRKR